jgi:hypothetical protein
MKLTTQTHRTRHHEDAIGLIAAFLLAAFAMILATAVAYALVKMVEKVGAVAAAREMRLTNNLDQASEEWIGFSSAVIPADALDWFDADDAAFALEVQSVQRWRLDGATNMAGPWKPLMSFWGSKEFAKEQALRVVAIDAAVSREFWPDREVVGFVRWVRVE